MKDYPDFLNLYSDKSGFVSDYANELFLFYLLPKLEVCFLDPETDFNICSILHENLTGHSKILISPVIFFMLLFGFAFSFFIFFYFLVLTLLKLNEQQYSNSFNLITVVRSEASISKICKQVGFSSSLVLADTFSYKGKGCKSLYRVKISKLPKIFLSFNYLLFGEIKLFLCDVFTFKSDKLKAQIVFHYFLRVPFKLLYQVFLDYHVSANDVNTLFSGEKEDRYAFAQHKICKIRKVKIICFPHGLEYGFRTPLGLIGDVFYCNTITALNVLKRIYPKDAGRFIFDKDVASRMLAGNNKLDRQVIDGIVFFPESRGVSVNRDIIVNLKRLEFDFIIKLHPLDSKSNYSDLVSLDKFSDDLEFCLDSKICIARKSTVLLEATYRGSVSCAILIDEYDRVYAEKLFPSLASEDINVFYNFESLKKFLEGNRFV